MTPPSDPTRWPEVKRLFEAALDHPSTTRETFLDAACRQPDGSVDVELRAAVNTLLRADADAEATAVTVGGFLAASPLDLGGLIDGLGVELAEAPEMPLEEAAPGTRIGPYRVIRLLGRGGMGEVYLAARADGLFERTVALKRVRADLAPSVAARFSTERQILADLVHPGIARLYAAGVDDEAGPWLALELVDGVPITEAARGLAMADRLELFVDVAEAVHHAHRRLVVHQDLKPSNVLVTETDDGRQIKLLDFGIATILSLDPNAEGPGSQAATRAYAAPEQLRSEPTTTATDVYGLGVLLYEVLTGRRAFRGTTSLDGSPPPPSTVTDPAAGGIESRQLEGDLDAICQMAMASEPDARYPSAEALATDLRRVLSHQPVTARPPSAAYRTRRYLRRHRAGVLTATLIVLGLAFATGFYTVRLAAERDRAERAAAEAQRAATEADRTAAFLESLFAESDPTVAEPGDHTARELLEAGDARVRQELADEPGVLAGVLATMGRVHRTLGQYARADSALQDAVALYEQTGLDPLGHRDALLQLANLHVRTEIYDVAEPSAREALRLDSLHASALESERLPILNTLGVILSDMKRFEEALVILEEVVQGRRALAADSAEAAVDLASNLNNLGIALLSLDRSEEALPLFDEAVAIVREHRGDDHPYVAFALHARAGAHKDVGDFARAEADERQALRIGAAALGPDHPFCLLVQEQIADLVSRRAEPTPLN